MRKFCTFLVLLAICQTSALAQPEGKLVKEYWDAAFLEGQKSGFVRTTTYEKERGGQKFLHTNIELNLTLKRYHAVVNLRMESGAEETPGGRVTKVFVRQFLGAGQELNLTGTVAGDNLHITSDNGKIDKKITWNKDVIGLHRQQHLCQERKVKPGDRFAYYAFEPGIQSAVVVRIAVKDEQEVEVLDARKKLLRVEVTPDKIELSGNTIQLPPVVLFLDKDYQPARTEMEMPGVGKIVLYRTTRAIATAPSAADIRSVDLGLKTIVPLNRPIRNPHETKRVVYRITIKDDENPRTAFAADERQQIKNVQGNTFELHVQAVRRPHAQARQAGDSSPVPLEKGGPKQKPEAELIRTLPSEVPQSGPDGPGDEYRKSCYFLNSDDEQVKQLAQKIVGTETDPWEKTQLIEKWVCKSMRGSNAIAFATASQIARELQGDCRQHAVLAAALCRAADVPSRTALGLVYFEGSDGKPGMAFHMWAEVWIAGQWIAIDPTLGQGGIGAAHIKIAHHSWHNTETLSPLLTVVRVLGRLTIEVLEG